MTRATLTPSNCPCCGGEAKTLVRKGHNTVRRGIGQGIKNKFYREKVRCNDCGLQTEEEKSPNKAVRLWNKRIEKWI